MKKYLSVAMFADKYGVAERTVRNYCANGKIEGAFLIGKTWNIPADAALPVKNKHKEQVMPLLEVLREQKQMRLKGSIYHRTQIDLTYNSNHIEGSRLTHDQTRYIFETNTGGVTDDGVKVDQCDVVGVGLSIGEGMVLGDAFVDHLIVTGTVGSLGKIRNGTNDELITLPVQIVGHPVEDGMILAENSVDGLRLL